MTTSTKEAIKDHCITHIIIYHGPSFFSWIFGLKKYMAINNIENINGIFLSTAHL